MLAKRKLSGGGDVVFDKYIAIAGTTGVDLVELLWIPRNRQPYYGTPAIVGYEVPIQDNVMISFDSDGGTCSWTSGSIKFFPDDGGFCYGYVFLTETNKELLASSLATGWFRIIDRDTRKEIEEYAIEKGYSITVNEVTNVSVKKDPYSKTIEKKLAEANAELERLRNQMKAKTKETDFLVNEKKMILDKKAKGVKAPVSENIPEEFKKD